MKLQFKHQQFQLDAVAAITDLFQGQPRRDGVHYMANPGLSTDPSLDLIHDAYRNNPIELDESTIKERVNAVQSHFGLTPSNQLAIDKIGHRDAYNFSIEMETGTGKTYTYIRTIMELNKYYGWLKFIIVVPSVAIREGVLKSFEVMEDHFQDEFGKKPRYFVYNSSRLGDLDSFANSSDLQVMIINSQAFNARGKDARRIHMEQESFRWRRPIDVLAAMNPIMIIDEPQSVEGKKTKERLKDFEPLFTLRYSATHKEKYDMVYRLDAMDAYNQKLVKKIAVKAIERDVVTGVSGYLYLQEIIPQKTGLPKARIEFEKRTKNGIKRETRIISEPFNLYEESGNLKVYQGMVLNQFDARNHKLQIGPTQSISVGEVVGEIGEQELRVIQIRETIKSHIETEERLYNRKNRIKVLSLFFIDEVAKYKQYDDNNDSYNGEYAEIFVKEYERQVSQYIRSHKHEPSPYLRYLEKFVNGNDVHAGYFSVDKAKKSDKIRFIDFKSASERKANLSNDTDAYDLIMKDKERLLSFDEPVRFIFSHSALKEGWDNPNIFQICTLKQSSSETRKRQEIGRGMRLAVDQNGVRQDADNLGRGGVHNINRLTVIANESYEEFSRGLQEELKEILKDRPVKVNSELFLGKTLTNLDGQSKIVTDELANRIQNELSRNDYIDFEGNLTKQYFKDKSNGRLQLSEFLLDYHDSLITILDTVYHPTAYKVENANLADIVFRDEINHDNIEKAEFKKLWNTINRKTSYRVEFDDRELVDNAVSYINDKLSVSQPTFTITNASADYMTQAKGLDFTIGEDARIQEKITSTEFLQAYDLIGEIAENTQLTRKTVVEILTKLSPNQFDKFKINPEEFILKTSKLINEQKASQIVKHIQYNILDQVYEMDLFYENPETAKRDDPLLHESNRSIYNYTKVDSDVEGKFQQALEQYEDVKVYVKLPSDFHISTPLGNYNPDWAIAFREGAVKHVYFVAETKGSMSSLQLKGTEEAKIACAKAHFQALKEKGLVPSDHVYGVVSNYQELMNIVRE